MKYRISQLSQLLSRKLHIPIGAAVVVAILLVPKILAAAVAVWYILSLAGEKCRHRKRS